MVAPALEAPTYLRVYVWEVVVRVTHWLIVAAIVVLTITGLYLHGPFMAPGPGEADPTLMATVRFIHELAAFVFTTAVAVRVYWAFVGNRYAHWRGVVRRFREDWREAGEMLSFYLFRRPEPPFAIGHNHLASAFYCLVYAGFLGQIIGFRFLLFAWVLGSGPIAFFFSWVDLVPGGIETVRLLHYLLMFAFIAFAIHHVYSSVLIDLEERSGLVLSMVTGFRVLPAQRPGTSARS